MAEAIARHYLSKPHATKKPTRVASAGVATSYGLAMTAEAKEALERLRIDPGRHRSRVLTREMVEDATVIYAMTRSHAQQAIAMVPTAKDKIQILDPSGRDVADPIGSSLATYVQTAETIANFIRTRLTADGTLTLPRKKSILEPG
jgi:protein-tyrosine-phosphatase